MLMSLWCLCSVQAAVLVESILLSVKARCYRKAALFMHQVRPRARCYLPPASVSAGSPLKPQSPSLSCRCAVTVVSLCSCAS